VDDVQVRFQIGKLKTETRMVKDALRKIDVWHDSSLFDLKVHHNKAARNKTDKDKKQRETDMHPIASRSRTYGHRIGPGHPKWKELRAVEKMKNLWHVLDMDMRLHMEKPDQNLNQEFEANEDEELEVTMMPSPARKPGFQRSSTFHLVNKDTAATLAKGIESLSEAVLTRTRRGSFTQVNPEIKHVALNLLEFLLERCSNIADFLHVLDVSDTGRISRRDWETALMAMGCVSDEPSRFFKAMDTDATGEIMVDDVLEVLKDLKDHVPALASRQDRMRGKTM
jgi:hypothetical protein